jgi:glycosyltransferase involved in cell wall biosynthesis
MKKLAKIGKSSSKDTQKNSDMRISIVTPSLNQCVFIPEMLASLGSQDYPDWEHVVFDAGSTDGSVEVWREWEERGKLRNGETETLRNGKICYQSFCIDRAD